MKKLFLRLNFILWLVVFLITTTSNHEWLQDTFIKSALGGAIILTWYMFYNIIKKSNKEDYL